MVLKNFIVFEGIDGSGTSTQIKVIKQKLSQINANFFVTCEPTDNEIGKFIRTILKGHIKFDPKTLAYLFAADRCEHIFGQNGIEQKCNNGQIVISDRYLFSSLAYQSASCGLELPSTLNSFFPLPQLLFYFYIDPEISLKRVISRDGNDTEIFENLQYQQKTYDWYNKVILNYQNQNDSQMKIIKIDATQSIEQISQIIWGEVSKLPINSL